MEEYEKERKIFAENCLLKTSNEEEIVESYKLVELGVKSALKWCEGRKKLVTREYDELNINFDFILPESVNDLCISGISGYFPEKGSLLGIQECSANFLDYVNACLNLRRIGLNKKFDGLENILKTIISEFKGLTKTQQRGYGNAAWYLNSIDEKIKMMNSDSFSFSAHTGSIIYKN